VIKTGSAFRGSGFWVQRFRVLGSGVQGFRGSEVLGSGFWVQGFRGSGFWVQGFRGSRVLGSAQSLTIEAASLIEKETVVSYKRFRG